MAKTNSIRDMKPRQVKARVDELLRGDWSDVELRDKLEELSEARAFGGFTWLWGPDLYQKNRVLFRPFILSHFSSYLIENWNWKFIDWKGQKGHRLDRWFGEVESAGDAELFKRLYGWKHQKGQWEGLDQKKWRSDLLERYRRAKSPADRQQVLAMFDLPGEIRHGPARELYEIDPVVAGPFILKHLTNVWEDEKRKLWRELYDAALQRSDEAFAFQLYRKQVSTKIWQRDILDLAEQEQDSAELCEQLEKRHPEGYGLDLGKPVFKLVEKRGRDVLPYVHRHLGSVYRSWYGGRDGYTKLVKLAAKNEWWDLWSGLVRTCSNQDEYQQHVTTLVKDKETDEEIVQNRLLMLTGVSREWNQGPFALAQVQQLDDESATLLYRRFPHLLRGPFKMHVSGGWFGAYDKLADRVLRAEDEVLIDYLASRFVTRFVSPYGWGSDQVDTAKKLSTYYEKFRDDSAEFSRRAVQVLGQVPAYTFANYNESIRTNRLARMFYERAPQKYLDYPEGIRDLLESPEIHTQALAFRVLGLQQEEARQLAAQNLDLLQAALLRPLHRKTRLLAFTALENAAVDEESAAAILLRCRQSMDLPDQRYPKEKLIGLIGRILYRWPTLRNEREQPVVYGALV